MDVIAVPSTQEEEARTKPLEAEEWRSLLPSGPIGEADAITFASFRESGLCSEDTVFFFNIDFVIQL